MFPTTVGIVAKKPPLEAPFTMTKTIMGASVLDMGQSASMLKVLSVRARKSVLSGPRESQK